jgi:hypothetical protein
VLSFSDLHLAMKTITPVESATDAQLRMLVRPFEWHSQYWEMIQSQLPLLTVERAELIGLLKSVDTHYFMH